jgi:hypothetical protein
MSIRVVYDDSRAETSPQLTPIHQEKNQMQSRFTPALVVALVLAAQPLLSQETATPVAEGQSTPQAATGARPHGPQPKPVNLKVLPKDMAREDLIKLMRGYVGALGVKCNFCHAANPQTHKLDFPSDAKDDKTIARTMIAMTQTINEQYMAQVHDPDAMPEDKHVTCGTCHRGHSMPEHFVPPPEQRHHPPAGAAPGEQPQ